MFDGAQARALCQASGRGYGCVPVPKVWLTGAANKRTRRSPSLWIRAEYAQEGEWTGSATGPKRCPTWGLGSAPLACVRPLGSCDHPTLSPVAALNTGASGEQPGGDSAHAMSLPR